MRFRLPHRPAADVEARCDRPRSAETSVSILTASRAACAAPNRVGASAPRRRRRLPAAAGCHALVLGSLLPLAALSASGCSTAAPAPAEPPITRVSTVARSTMAASDGVSLSYEVRGAGDTALVFIHCWACDRTFWREQLDVFDDHYLVVALDLAGHGASGHRNGGGILDLGADVAKVVGLLGLERVVLVGHSMGGPVALAAGRLLGERVSGIVCLDSLHNAEMEPPPGMVEEMTAAFAEDFGGAMEGFVRSAVSPSAPPATVDWLVAKARGADPVTAVELLRDFPNLRLEELFASAGAPIRCINAAPQGAVGTPTEVEINRRYADFDAELMEGVGHFLHLEAPGEVNSRIRRYVEELSGRDP